MQSNQKLPKILIEPLHRDKSEIGRKRGQGSLQLQPKETRPVSEQGQKKRASYEEMASTPIVGVKEDFSDIGNET